MKEDYRPAIIEFNIAHDGTNVPMSLGDFETPEEAAKFIGAKLVFLNYGVTVSRHMDTQEKKDTREDYADIMENLLPVYEKELSASETNLTNAKASLKAAEEAYNFTLSRAKNLAAEAKRGLRDIICEEHNTYRVPYKGRFYFFNYIDGQLKLCLIRDMMESDKTEIWSQMSANEEYIDKQYAPKQAKKK